MCRLFGMSGGPSAVAATFWLLDAPDSLLAQSRREPDGCGLGWYELDGPRVHREPIAAYEDAEFSATARTERSPTFVAHVRFASTGGVEPRNTHPFVQDERLLAHNGVVEDLARLEAELGDDMSLVEGETDSERVFALITREVRRRDGDLASGVVAAASWIARELPVFALNLVLSTPTQLVALRYPETHELWVLERGAGGTSGQHHLEGSSARGTIHVRSQDLREQPSVIVASERLDESADWRLMDVGELLVVDHDLTVTRTIALPDPPARRLTLADLDDQAATSQVAATAPPAA